MSTTVDGAHDRMAASQSPPSPTMSPGSSTRRSGGRRYIWDEWEEGAEQPGSPREAQAGLPLASPASSISTSSHAPRSISNATMHTATSSATATAFRDVQAKVSTMMRELEDRKEEIATLRHELATIKQAAQKSKAKTNEEWSKRRDATRAAQDEELTQQREFTSQVARDARSLQDKCDTLETQIERLERQRVVQVESVQRDNVATLKTSREQWVKTEKERLTKLAEERAAELKEDAVRALEPSLHDLISKHRLELRDREEQLRGEEQRLARQLRETRTQQVSDCRRTLEKRHEDSVREHRHTWTQELKRAMADHEHHLRELRRKTQEASASERAAEEDEWKALRQAFEADMDDIKMQFKQRASQSTSQHQKEVEVLLKRHRSDVDRARRQQKASFSTFCRSVLGRLSRTVLSQEEETLASLRARADEEVNMVRRKLQEEDEKDQVGLRTDFESRLRDLEALLAKEEARLETQRDDAERAVSGKTARNQELASTLKGLERDIEDAENKTAKLRCGMEDMRATEVEQTTREGDLAAQVDKVLGEKERAHAGRLLEATRRRDEIRLRLDEQRRNHEATLDELEQRYEAEITSVNQRVEKVLRKKEEEALRSSKALELLQKSNDDSTRKLEALRRQHHADATSSGLYD